MVRLEKPGHKIPFDFKKLILFYNKNNEIFYTTTYRKSNGVFYSYPQQLKKDEKMLQSYLCLNQSVKNVLQDRIRKSDNINFTQGDTEVVLKRSAHISCLAVMTYKLFTHKREDVHKLFKSYIYDFIYKIERDNWQDLIADKEIKVDKRELTQNLADILNQD